MLSDWARSYSPIIHYSLFLHVKVNGWLYSLSNVFFLIYVLNILLLRQSFPVGITWGKGGPNAPTIIFLPKKSFFWLLSWREEIKKWGESGGKGCMCIKDWFKPILPALSSVLLVKLRLGLFLLLSCCKNLISHRRWRRRIKSVCEHTVVQQTSTSEKESKKKSDKAAN
jgi:hypothetical protein